MTRYIASLVVISLCCGCASLGQQQTAEPELIHETSASRAVRCLCLWQVGEAEDSGGRHSRGFVGQVHFFNGTDASPVAVAGDVRVFVFDDIGTDEEQTRPIHQFDLPSNAFQGFLKSTQIGPGYQIFVPYPRPGRHEANCSLRLRLTRPDGSRLFSEMVQINLAGTERASKVADANARDLPLAEELPQKLRLKSETLGVRQDGNVMLTSGVQPEHRGRSLENAARFASTQDKLRDIFQHEEPRPRTVQHATPDRRISARALFEGEPDPSVVPHTPASNPFTDSGPIYAQPVPVEIRMLSRPLSREPERRFEAESIQSVTPQLPDPMPIPQPAATGTPFGIELPMPLG